MLSFHVVVVNKLTACFVHLMAIIELFQVQFFIFDGSEETLYEGVVGRASFAIHWYLNVFKALDVAYILLWGELTALVRVDYLRTAMLLNSIRQGSYHPISLHGVGKTPAPNVPAVDVYNGC